MLRGCRCDICQRVIVGPRYACVYCYGTCRLMTRAIQSNQVYSTHINCWRRQISTCAVIVSNCVRGMSVIVKGCSITFGIPSLDVPVQWFESALAFVASLLPYSSDFIIRKTYHPMRFINFRLVTLVSGLYADTLPQSRITREWANNADACRPC